MTDYQKPFQDLSTLIPSNIANSLNTSWLKNLFNRQFTHEEASRFYGLIGRYFPSTTETRPWIAQLNTERQVNMLTPIAYTEQGTDQYMFSFTDFVDKAKEAGFDIDNMATWAKAQAFNFAPPIDIDKFTNFSNYYWVQQAIEDADTAWNPNKQPEYYTIAKPKIADSKKLAVSLATNTNITLNGTTYPDQIWVITFGDPLHFFVDGLDPTTSAIISPGAGIYTLSDTGTTHVQNEFISFYIGNYLTASGSSFKSGDTFRITIKQITSQPAEIDRSSVKGSGSLYGVVGTKGYATIDGVKLVPGMRILVKNQTNPSENGIYVVGGGGWSYAYDFLAANLTNGFQVYVKNGTQKGTWSYANGTAAKISNLSNMSDWEAGNYWVHADDLTNFYDLSTSGSVIQALRPIIEYHNDLELTNTVKTRFNQVPLFYTYWLDDKTLPVRTPWVSSLFYYEEDHNAAIDLHMQRRLKTDSDANFYFGQGCISPNGRLLGYKQGSIVKSCWAPGPTLFQVTEPEFAGTGTGSIATIGASLVTVAESFTLTAFSATKLHIIGSRTGTMPDIDTTLPYNTSIISLTFTSCNFNVGDVITFSIVGPEHPRYVTLGSDGVPITYPQNPSQDTSGVGCWLNPPQLMLNPLYENRAELLHGDLTDHFTNIIADQATITGSPFGRNNFRNINYDLGLGGNIRSLMSPFNLLFSLMNQQDMTPVTLIDFMEQQYGIALNSINEYILNALPTDVAKLSVAQVQSLNASTTGQQVANILIPLFFSLYKTNYAARAEIASTYFDTTTPIPGWGLTLPLIGAIPAVQPIIKYDYELGIDVIVCHDCHEIGVIQSNPYVEQNMALTPVLRYDGTTTPGSVSATQPAKPYKGQLWFDSTHNQLKFLNIQYEGSTAPTTATLLDYWYNQTTDVLSQFTQSGWTPSVTFPWIGISFSGLANSLILQAETALYNQWLLNNATGKATQWTPTTNTSLLSYELSKYAVANNADPYGSVYEATSAFTWNYHNVDWATLYGLPAGLARWHVIYREYFKSKTGVATERPDLEPWAIFGQDEATFLQNPTYVDQTTGAFLWANIAQYANVKLCVNPATGKLLPPYVNANSPGGQYALLNIIPSGIADSYVFGDEGPTELLWRKSVSYNYSVLRASLKLDPIKFLQNLWGFQTFSNNGLILDKFSGQMLGHNRFTLHGDPRPAVEVLPTFTCTSTTPFTLIASYQAADGAILFTDGANVITDLTPNNLGLTIQSNGYQFVIGDKLSWDGTTVTFTPVILTVYNGLNQVFINFLRYTSLDTSTSINISLFRNWDLRLGYRFGTMVDTDTLELTATDNSMISKTAYDVYVKKSSMTASSWIQALRVQVVTISANSQYVGLDTNGNKMYVPTNKGNDWVFRIENYFPRHPQVQRYDVYTNQAEGTYQTFDVLNKTHCKENWFNNSSNGTLLTTNLPIIVTGIQAVIDFVQGYNDKLVEDGWAFGQGDNPPVDQLTSRVINWQLAIEKFIDGLYMGTPVGNGYMLNPMMAEMWFNTPLGILAPFNFSRYDDVLTSQYAYDILGDIINVDALSVVRNDEQAQITSQVPMFGAHINVDQYEHVILFNNYGDLSMVETNYPILFYDPFLGISIEKLLIAGKAQANITFRPSFGGFFLSGHEMKKNIAASIDDFSDYYNTDHVFDNRLTTRHALAVLGFSKKSYFDLMNVTDKAQFNFWRGLVGSKGTNYCVEAFTNSINLNSVVLDEFWAYKLAEYGDNRPNNYPELKLNTVDCSTEHTRLFFKEGSTDAPQNATDNYIIIDPLDETRWFTLDDLSTTLSFTPDYFDHIISVSTANQLIELPQAESFELITGPGTMVIANTVANAATFSATGEYVVRGWVPAKSKFSPITLIDYATPATIGQIQIWHPAFGLHTNEAYEVLNFITTDDPARYNYSTLLVGNPNFDPPHAWGEREVGTTWWDTTNLDYIPYYDKNIFSSFEERLARWGSLADYAQVKVYEWVASTTAPIDYDAASVLDQLNADIPTDQKRTGTVARKQSYSSSRNWLSRPIAWSYVPNPNNSVLALNYAVAQLFLSSIDTGPVTLMLDYNSFNTYGITSGTHLSAWQNGVPYGELEITGNQQYALEGGTFTGVANDTLAFTYTSSSPTYVNVFTQTVVTWTNNTSFKGSAIGPIAITIGVTNQGQPTEAYTITLTETDTGISETQVFTNYAGAVGDTVEYTFQSFGLKIVGYTNVSSYTPAQLYVEWLNTPFDVFIRTYIVGNILVPFPTNSLTNYLEDALTPGTGYYGWRAWTVPTQIQLAADLASPNNSWTPIFGNWANVPTSSTLVTNIVKYSKAPFTLNTSEAIEYYSSTWNDWNLLANEQYNELGQGTVWTKTFTQTMDTTKFALYINGILQPTSSYTVKDQTVTTQNAIQVGFDIIAILTAYQPSAADLAFDPTVEDDSTIQTKYKVDYQYVTRNLRDTTGNIIGQTYYFWVENKTVPLTNKSVSCSQAATLLKTGPDMYLTLQEYKDNVYKACTIFGLNSEVLKDNTFKLRFTEDYILRDDPNGLSLKNSHTEWTMIRPNQTKVIPAQLWNKLVDSACGLDVAGNQIPSLKRKLYDERNGTKVQFGFGLDQALADQQFILTTLTKTLLKQNTNISLNTVTPPIQGLDYSNPNKWFVTASSTRQLLTFIWQSASPLQINELFFAVMDDALANNYEFTDIFKTSMISVHSKMTIQSQTPVIENNAYF